MKKLTLMFLAGSVLMSCVNEEYDLNKVDGTAVIAKDIAMPIGNLQKLSVNQILDFASETEFISKDANGDLKFTINGGTPQSASITVPSFTIPFENEIVGNDHLIFIDVRHKVFDPIKVFKFKSISQQHNFFRVIRAVSDIFAHFLSTFVRCCNVVPIKGSEKCVT
jgi:hypothetical protein